MELKELIAYTILAMIFCLTAVVLLVFYCQKKYGNNEDEYIEEEREEAKYRHWSED